MCIEQSEQSGCFECSDNVARTEEPGRGFAVGAEKATQRINSFEERFRWEKAIVDLFNHSDAGNFVDECETLSFTLSHRDNLRY